MSNYYYKSIAQLAREKNRTRQTVYNKIEKWQILLFENDKWKRIYIFKEDVIKTVLQTY